MAGGIDWFRWHHATVTDQKFGLVAKKAEASVAEVIAVWACLLESASCSEERGVVGVVDFEAMDFALGMNDGKAKRIHAAMVDRNLIDAHGHVVQWPKRQPKREDDTAADRQRRKRERDHAARSEESVTPIQSRDVTQSHADVTHGHDRGEERRGDIEIQDPTGLLGSPPAGVESGTTGQVVKLPDRRIPCPADALLEAFHQECPTLPRVIKLNEKRRQHLTARWREVDADSKFSSAADGVEIFSAIFRKVNASDFLAGRAKSWHATFDWLTESSTNFLKVCEGHYDNDRRAAK